MIGHLIKFVQVAVGIDVAEASSNRLVNKKQISEFIPRSVVVFQIASFSDSIRSDLHERAIKGATSRPAVQPNDGSLLVRDVSVLVVPEEQVSVVLWIDFDVSVTSSVRPNGRTTSQSNLPCMHLQEW